MSLKEAKKRFCLGKLIFSEGGDNCLRKEKVATLCLDDRFAQSWHSLNQLHEVVT
jgi:hypothetical protein